MGYDPHRHHRRSIRLPGYDYAQAGAYFVTICVEGHECLLGEVRDAQMVLSPLGEVVEHCWSQLVRHFPGVQLGAFVVMPNHVHGIIHIRAATGDSGRDAKPEGAPERPGTRPRSLGAIVQSFKSVCSRRTNRMRQTGGGSLWQRNYYEHVVRDAEELERIELYIAGNPARWEEDEENPHRRPAARGITERAG